MTRVTTVGTALIGILALVSCGSETTSSTGGGGSAGQDATGAGGTAGGGGSGQGGGQTGCVADPSICAGAMVCCSGVPYPPEGICEAACDMDSDRAIKHDVRPVDGDRVLEQLAAVEVSRWRYDASPDREHMGPMAQDFRAAFGLGGDGRHIATVDANGVTMAAVQALYARVLRLEAQAAERERDNRKLRIEIEELQKRLSPSATK